MNSADLPSALPQLVDAHVHVWSGDRTSYPYGPHDNVPQPSEAFPAERLHDAMRTAGVHQALAIQPRLLGYDHAYLLHTTRQLQPNVRALPLVNLARPTNVAEMTFLADQPAVAGFRAVALDPEGAAALLGPAADGLWTSLARRRLPVGILTAPEFLPAVAALARRRPELAIVVDHLAGIAAPDWSRHAPDLLGMATAPGVRIKLSALGHLSRTPFPYPDLHRALRQVVAEFGAERTMWGSDWPHTLGYGGYHLSSRALMLALHDLDPRDTAMIFAKTASVSFGFPTPGPYPTLDT